MAWSVLTLSIFGRPFRRSQTACIESMYPVRSRMILLICDARVIPRSLRSSRSVHLNSISFFLSLQCLDLILDPCYMRLGSSQRHYFAKITKLAIEGVADSLERLDLEHVRPAIQK